MPDPNDPLSTATRATKRNLLIASVLAISANAFNVSVDKIPIGGLSLTFDDRLFAFLIFITLTYFLCTFILYYVIDIKNLEETGHQESAMKKFDQRQYDFEQSYGHRAARDLEKIFLPKYHLMFYTDGSGTPEYAANTYTVFEAPKLPNG